MTAQDHTAPGFYWTSYPSIPTPRSGHSLPVHFSASRPSTQSMPRGHSTRASWSSMRRCVFLACRSLALARLTPSSPQQRSGIAQSENRSLAGLSLTCPGNRLASWPSWENGRQPCYDMQETWRPPSHQPPYQQLGFLAYFRATGLRGGEKSYAIRTASISGRALLCLRQKAGIPLILSFLGNPTVLMKRGDLGAGGVTDKGCGQRQQMGDLALPINCFPAPLLFHTPSFDFVF